MRYSYEEWGTVMKTKMQLWRLRYSYSTYEDYGTAKKIKVQYNYED